MAKQTAEKFAKMAKLEAWILVRLVLCLLSTHIGTLLLCGTLCFDGKWPFLYRFPNMSVQRREKVLQRWTKHRFLTPIRVAFCYVKAIFFFTIFSMVCASLLLLLLNKHKISKQHHLCIWLRSSEM